MSLRKMSFLKLNLKESVKILSKLAHNSIEKLKNISKSLKQTVKLIYLSRDVLKKRRPEDYDLLFGILLHNCTENESEQERVIYNIVSGKLNRSPTISKTKVMPFSKAKSMNYILIFRWWKGSPRPFIQTMEKNS
jgi:hypothetical protein